MIRGKLFGLCVGCRYRWPYDHAHPDCWQPPLPGTVLALDDPRAWKGTLAFPCRDGAMPDDDKVTRHVMWCLSENLLTDKVPVLYTAVDGDEFLQWDGVDSLLPYQEELKAWRAARRLAYTERGRCRLYQEEQIA